MDDEDMLPDEPDGSENYIEGLASAADLAEWNRTGQWNYITLSTFMGD